MHRRKLRQFSALQRALSVVFVEAVSGSTDQSLPPEKQLRALLLSASSKATISPGGPVSRGADPLGSHGNPGISLFQHPLL